MKQHCTMGSWLLLSVTLLVAVLPGLLASSLHAASLPQRGMFKVAVKDTKCKGQLTSCDGCSKIRNCVQFGSGFYNAGSETNCSGATPYCVEKDKAASCVAMVPASSNCNKPQTANYTCTQVGYFPDVSDCTKYFVCLMDSATKEMKSYAYDCSPFPGTRYDAATGRCKLGTCLTLKCPNPSGTTFQLWTQAPWIYTSCLDNDPKNALVGACPQGQSWNGTACNQACQQEGRFAILNDTTKTKYIECAVLDSSGKLSAPVSGECPPGSTLGTDGLCK